MNRKTIILLLLIITLWPNYLQAQFFAKQKVVVWTITDVNNDVKVAESTKQQIRTSIVDAFVGSRNYEAFEVNVNDVYGKCKAQGLAMTQSNIVSVVNELSSVDYVLFTTMKIVAHSNSYDDYRVLLSSDLVSTATRRNERTAYVEMKSDVSAIPNACSNLLGDLLGEQLSTQNKSSQKQQPYQSQNTTYDLKNIHLSKSELQRAGFRFEEGGGSWMSINGVNGKADIFVHSDLPDYKVPRKYLYGNVNQGKLSGLVLYKTQWSYYVTYFVDGEMLLPLLEAYFYDNSYLLGVDEGRWSYGIRHYDLVGDNSWHHFGTTEEGRLFANEMVRIYGDNIKQVDFLINMSKGIVDMETLHRNFVSFVRNGNYISPSAWHKDED